MTTTKAVLLAALMTSLLTIAMPTLGQDADDLSANDEATSDNTVSDGSSADGAAAASGDPASADSATGDEPGPPAPASNAQPGEKSADLVAEKSADLVAENAPAQNRPMTIELAGPAANKEMEPAESRPSDSLKLTTSPPATKNPFIALGDEMFLGTLLIGAWGIHFWDWFEQSFHFEKEHGFTQESSTGGADKTGHFFTAYIFADFLNWRLRRQGWSRLRSAIVGSSVAMGLMTWIEVGDGTSAYGWSWEDMLADFIGVAISAGLALSPTADELFDFRLEYWPTKSYMDGGVMAADYSGMKYLMALRMTGIKPLKKTPLRFLEFHLGYYSRGFRTFDKATETNRVVYFGLGIDVKEILQKFMPKKYMRPFDVALTYYQPPYTSWALKEWEHRQQVTPRQNTPAAGNTATP